MFNMLLYYYKLTLLIKEIIYITETTKGITIIKKKQK
jgi:hypothetical protein